jgi:hypothetical protein
MNNVHPAFEHALWFAPPTLPKRGHSRTTEVEYAGINFTVAYDYSPAERPVYDADSPLAGPGCAASVDAYEIKLGEHDITELLAESVRDDIEAKILEQLGES